MGGYIWLIYCKLLDILYFFSIYLFLKRKNQYFCASKNKGSDSVAQQVEHIPFKDGVLGSNPS